MYARTLKILFGRGEDLFRLTIPATLNFIEFTTLALSCIRHVYMLERFAAVCDTNNLKGFRCQYLPILRSESSRDITTAPRRIGQRRHEGFSDAHALSYIRLLPLLTRWVTTKKKERYGKIRRGFISSLESSHANKTKRAINVRLVIRAFLYIKIEYARAYYRVNLHKEKTNDTSLF